MNKGTGNFQIDDFFRDEENEDLKKIYIYIYIYIYGNLFNRFNN